ncbi:MAG TPA: DedA family protein [Acidiferrobacter sp.]|nr:DedA family protein [Acidiferrobacter sp.]
MIDLIVRAAAHWMLATIQHFGYTGIVALMTLESACIPVPSEVIMTFSGYLVSTHAMTLIGITVAGTVGNVVGSLVAYAIGARGGRPFLERYGRYILINRHDLDRTHAWFERHGQVTVFIGRLLPVVRTFISLPAGIGRMPLLPFILYSAAGSFIWCAVLGWIGLRLGNHWRALGPYMHGIDMGVVAVALALILMTLWRHMRRHDN